MAVVGIPGGPGAGFPGGNVATFGFNKAQILSPVFTTGGGSGGFIGAAGNKGDDGTGFGGLGGSAGSNGAAGSTGTTGYAIVGYNNISQIVSTGNITGSTINTASFLPNVTNIAFITANTTNSNSISVPATANAGDLAIFFDTARHTVFSVNVSPTTKVIPSGWTELMDVAYDGVINATDLRSTISYKILTETDIANTVVGMQDSTVRKMILCFRTNEYINNVFAYSVNNRAEHVAISNTNLNLTSQTGILIAGVHHTTDAALQSYYTYSPKNYNITLGDISGPNITSQLVRFNIYNSTDPRPNGIVSLDDTSGINVLQSFFFRII